jgi:hypothetical protein
MLSGVTDNVVKAEVHGIIQGVPVPWPIHNPDACQSSGLTCPLQPGNNYHYTASFPIQKSYPTVSVNPENGYKFIHQVILKVKDDLELTSKCIPKFTIMSCFFLQQQILFA